MKNDKFYEINDYEKAIAFLKEKYKDFPMNNYYSSQKSKYTTNNKYAASNGLQRHHIYENKIANLGDHKTMQENDFSYQLADNLVYCNLYEHLYLHILIAEQTTDKTLGVYGCRAIVDDIISSLIGRSSKQNYNKNNILSDNFPLFKYLINRLCTSAYIRDKLNKTPEAIYTMLGFDKNIFLIANFDSTELLKTKLQEHNVTAFASLLDYLADNRTAILQICTCGGKTTSGLELCRVLNARALVLTPNDTVKNYSWADKNGKPLEYIVEVMNYQTFMNRYALLDYTKYDIIICDEVHHTDAPRWGEGLQWVLDNTNLKVVGLTATPTELQKTGDDKYFGGRICYGLDIAEGINEGIFWPFDYYQSIFLYENLKPQFEQYNQPGKLLYDKLCLVCNFDAIVAMIKRGLSKYNNIRKGIVFISSERKGNQENDTDIKKNYEEACKILKAINPLYEGEEYVRFISSDKNKKYNDEAREWFNRDDSHDKWLITVNMVNEGAHYDGVNTAIMLRKTDSLTLFLQQLGRVIRTVKDRKGNKTEDPTCVVFDISNNIENLIANSSTIEATDKLSATQLKKILEACKTNKFTQKIVDCEVEDIVCKFRALEHAKKAGQARQDLYDLSNKICLDLNIDIWSIFSEEWQKSGLKVSEKTNKELKETTKEVTVLEGGEDTELAEKKSTTAKDLLTTPELLYRAISTLVARCYLYGYLSVDFENTDFLVLNNLLAIENQIVDLGLRKPDAIMQLLKNLSLGVLVNILSTLIN